MRSIGHARTRPLEPLPEAPADVTVTAIDSAEGRDRFIQLQIELYRRDPRYVPPILVERRDFLNPAVNPFLAHAEMALFLAERNGAPVGRIAAINDFHYNPFHNSETGFFGMFECVEDAGVARALFDAAADWVRRRGLKQMVGPVNLSTNYDCGILIDGFDHPPAMMMPYNFPYYRSLFEANRMRKAKDLWAYEVSSSAVPPEEAVRQANQLRQEADLRVRPIDLRRLSDEIRRMKAVYDAMLEPQWGFVPMSDDEFHYMVARLKPIVQIRPELCLIAERHGEPVAFCITLPDSNIALKAAGGHLTRFGLPLGLMRMAWAARRIDRVRVLFMGMRPELRRRGLDVLLYIETLRAARARGFSGGEIGWIAEDNEPLNRALQSMGARRYKTLRLYEAAV